MNKIKVLCAALMLLAASGAGADDADPGWQEVTELRARGPEPAARQYRVDDLALRQRLQQAALRRAHEAPLTILLPMADGGTARFRLHESPIMQDALARRYPDIKTYKVYGIDDPAASGRLDITPFGFHAMLHTAQGRLFIDPDSGSPQNDRYTLRTRAEAGASAFSCSVVDFDSGATQRASAAARPGGGKLREYVLAVAATAEYVAKINQGLPPGNPVDRAQTAIVTAINRVNEIYERDLGLRLMLVAGNEQLIENGGNVTFSNGSPAQMFVENQAWIDATIGRGGYDVGHVFGTAGGGLAFLGSACDSNNKAKGVSAISNPLGNPFYIDFVAHEIGHQFDADHSFNGTSSLCASGRNAATAFEPGSGSSIMAYASLCGVENLQTLSDATFHAGSIAQVDSFTAGAGSCFDTVDTLEAPIGNTAIGAVAGKTIPANTAFELDAAATPGTADKLMYQWDQVDAGCPTDAASFGTDTGDNALFRSYPPRTVSRRHFPALGTQLRGFYDDAEVIPCHNRDLDFQFTARGNFSGPASTTARVSVVDTGSAFAVTNLDSPRTISTLVPFNVNWEVAATDQAPINCSNVYIDLLTFRQIGADPYFSYSAHRLETTLNTGTATVGIPSALQSNSHPRARIRVQCSDNIFYDISDADLNVAGTGNPTTDLFDDDDHLVFYNARATNGNTSAPACGAFSTCVNGTGGGIGIGGSRGGGSSAMDFHALLMLTGLLLLAAWRRRAGAQGLQ